LFVGMEDLGRGLHLVKPQELQADGERIVLDQELVTMFDVLVSVLPLIIRDRT
jgi:hypothetical protein